MNTVRNKILTLANLVSISRIFLTIPLIYYLNIHIAGFNWNVFFIVVIIIITDLLDGYIARLSNQITNFGKLIDPIADKICLMVITIYLIYEYQFLFLLFFILLSIRDFFLIILGIYLTRIQDEVFQSNRTGKLFVASTTITMFIYVFFGKHQIGFLFYLISLFLMALSTFYYYKNYKQYFKINKINN